MRLGMRRMLRRALAVEAGTDGCRNREGPSFSGDSRLVSQGLLVRFVLPDTCYQAFMR
jgi:hypothetical protein